ncbi:MAG: Vps62-related protein, partial [Ignavibacteriaceae bacterium]|nr:Vps62-related protein [Ignavibacteriaceae bacterium]
EPPATDDSAVLVSCLSVALVDGGTQTICVNACDKDGNPESFTATSGNTGIASVVKVDSTFIVTGISYGSTKITVTSNSGKSKEIPVTIYDPQILETDELLITFSQAFQYRWNDIGSGGDYNGSFYHPITTDGFFPLGSLGFREYYNPNGIWGVMVVKAKPGSNALAHPTDYILVYNDIGSGANDDGSFWTPVPPDGYVAMGTVAQSGYNKPSLTDVVCVREDLTVPGEAGAFIWIDQGTGANMWLGTWQIEPPVAGPHENAYLQTGTFVGWKHWNQPDVHPVMNVLNVKLPMLAETPYQQYAPRLTGFDPPPDETVPILAREMLVPCTIVSDPLYGNNQMWRVTNSPFYRLERQVFYKLLYHNHNQTSITQHNSYTRRYGVTSTESEEFWNETSISVTVEAGISIKMFEAKVSTTISKSFGYSTMTSVSELEESEYQSGVDVLPGKAVAIWQRWNRYVLKRHNGTSLEPVKAWEFGINSFITDEYPDE